MEEKHEMAEACCQDSMDAGKFAECKDTEIKADKTLRVAIDVLLQDLKALSESEERTYAIQKLKEAIMWLGMDLKRLGQMNPYPNSYKPENTVVDPTADGLKL